MNPEFSETLLNINLDDVKDINLSNDEPINPCYQKSRVIAAAASIFFTGVSIGGFVCGEITAKNIGTAYPIPVIFCVASYFNAIPFACYSVAQCSRNRIDLVQWLTATSKT